MPRLLTFPLDQLQTNAQLRKPAWEVKIYDLRSTTDTINDVAIFNATGTGSFETLAGPIDFTPDIVNIQVEESRGDFVNGGVVPTRVTMNLVDETGLWDPLSILGLSPTSQAYEDAIGRYFRKGNAVVIRMGDAQVDSTDWPFIFTGALAGQAGRSRNRSDGAKSTITLRALSREAKFVKNERTSSTFSQSNTFLQAALQIAQEEFGLDLLEIDLSGWGSTNFGHQSVQIVEKTPIGMLADLMFQDGFLPRFDGRGVLTQTTSTISSAVDRTYDDLEIIRALDRPASDLEQPDCVTVLGLSDTMRKIVQPTQKLATFGITTGFFDNEFEEDVFWSEDQSLVAENPQARVLKSVNGGLSFLGGDEEFEFIASPGPGGGTIGVSISGDTGFAPWLVTFLLVSYVVLAAIPDEVLYLFTIPVGRVIQALALAAALFVMTKIGRGSYEFHGDPMEFVYDEIRGRACVDGASVFERNNVTIENHLINNQSDADAAAMNALFLLQAEENPRTVQMLHDLRVEPDDIFEIPGGRTFLIDSIKYTLVRDSSRALRTTMGCYEVTPGVLA